MSTDQEELHNLLDGWLDNTPGGRCAGGFVAEELIALGWRPPLPAPSEDVAALIEEAEEFTNETVGYAFKSDWDHDQAVPLIRRLSAALAAALAARPVPADG